MNAPWSHSRASPYWWCARPTAGCAIAGIALDTAPGDAALEVQQPGSDPRSIPFRISPKEYRTQSLKVAPGQVNLSAEDEARVARESEKVRAALDAFTPDAPATLRLAQPVPGRRSGSFGLRRVFNGESRRPHSGMDIAAPVGHADQGAALRPRRRCRQLLLQRQQRDDRSRRRSRNDVLPSVEDQRRGWAGARRLAKYSAKSAPPGV